MVVYKGVLGLSREKARLSCLRRTGNHGLASWSTRESRATANGSGAGASCVLITRLPFVAAVLQDWVAARFPGLWSTARRYAFLGVADDHTRGAAWDGH